MHKSIKLTFSILPPRFSLFFLFRPSGTNFLSNITFEAVKDPKGFSPAILTFPYRFSQFTWNYIKNFYPRDNFFLFHFPCKYFPLQKKLFLFFRHIYRPYLLAWSHVFRLHCYLTGKMFLRKQVPDTKREVMQWHLHWRTVIFLKKK